MRDRGESRITVSAQVVRRFSIWRHNTPDTGGHPLLQTPLIQLQAFKLSRSPVVMSRLLRTRSLRPLETASVFHPIHDLLPKCVRKSRKENPPRNPNVPPGKPRQPSYTNFREKSLTRFWNSSPQTSNPSDRALSYPDHGFHRAAGTSSTPSSSLRWI